MMYKYSIFKEKSKMKKRILLVTLLVALFVCVFAISVSAYDFGSVTEIPGFQTVSGLDTTSRVLMSDGVTYPSAYIFKNKNDVSFDALNTAATKEYTATSVVAIEFPEGCTEVKRTFAGSTTIEYVRFSSTITGVQWGTFLSSTNLSVVEFDEDIQITAMNTDVFNNTGVTVLKLPNSVQTINDNFMRSCANLTTIYFGESFTQVFNRGALLAGCDKVKTIYMPAGVFDENGDISLSANFFGWNDRDHTGFLKGGVIYYTGTKAQAEKIVSTERALYQEKYSKESEYNTAVWWVIQTVSTDEYNALTAEQKAAGCYMVYEYNRCDAFYDGNHPEKLNEGETDTNPCVLTECDRCGIKNAYVGNDSTHNMSTVYAYANYFVNGTITESCQNAGCIYHTTPKVDNETLTPFFKELKYSTKEEGAAFGIYVEYKIDQDAIALYKELSKKTVNYGVMAIMTSNITGNGPLNVDGTTSANYVVAADVTNDKLACTQLIITGNWAENSEIEITMLGFVTDGSELHYMGSQDGEATTGTAAGAFNAVTYNNITEEVA